MVGVVQWCNTNSGIVMASLTLVYVIATIVVVALMVRANRLAARSTDVVIHLDKERSKPVVILDFIPEIPFFRMRVRNMGLTVAYDVQFLIVPTPVLCFGGKNSFPAQKTETKIRFIEEGIKNLAPQGEVSTTIGTLKRIQEGTGSLHFKGKITYSDSLGAKHETQVDVDLAIFRDLAYSGRKSIDNVAKELEKIGCELQHIGSGFHKPHVRTQDIHDFLKEEDEQIEQAVKVLEKRHIEQTERSVGQELSKSMSSKKPPI